ncbi:MAG: CHAP domain-containing protein, partial [Clostridiales bacterium]|nr:CHAP domain-containing protein [Candidatus Blautia equi]
MKKRILSVLLALSLLAGLGGPAGAEELTRGENTVRVENAEGTHSQNEKKFDLMVQGELDQYLKEHPEQDGTNSEYRNANFRTRAAAPLALAGTTSADLVVETAREMIGDSGVPNTYTYWMGAIDGSYAYAWCHAFVSWAAAQAGAGSIIPKTASCFIGMNWFVNRGRFRYASSGYVPLKGDIIYFDWDNGYGTIDHVGIVDRVSNGIVYTIEGNTTNSVRGRTYQLTDSSIVGYGIPEYDYRGEDSSNGGTSANSLGTGVGSTGTGSGNTSVTAGNQGSSSAESVDSCHCTSSYQGLYKCTATKSPLTIRKGHGTDFAVLGSIPIGASSVQVNKADGTWAHVTYNGVSGYCYMYFLEKTTSASPLPHCA